MSALSSISRIWIAYIAYMPTGEGAKTKKTDVGSIDAVTRIISGLLLRMAESKEKRRMN